MSKLIFIVGPDKSGKTTLQQNLVESLPRHFHRVVSLTTRSPREGENVDGLDYRFVSDEEFDQLKDFNGLLQNVTYGDYQYGTKAI